MDSSPPDSPMSNFAFLRAGWPDLHEAASKSEALAFPDARTACFHGRRALEVLVQWLYKHDASLRVPYQDNLSALIHEPTFKAAAGTVVFAKAVLINRIGNKAVHGHRPVPQFDALTVVRELFHIGYWLVHTYGRGPKPPSGLAFDANALPKTSPLPKQTVEQLQRLEAELRSRDERLSALLKDRENLDEELQRLRDEVAAIKRANASQSDTHDYSEAQTRDAFIDLLLKEAGWNLDQRRDREYPVTGMPNQKGDGFADYVLWGDDGLPLAVVEAKRTKRDARVGQQQAKLYADCMEKQFGQRPVIFYTNGYEHWIWDDAQYPPRPVQGFYKKAELELVIQRRTTRRSLASEAIDEAIVARHYQIRAIRRIGESFERDHDRKALVVMATGAGKTRTVIALCDLLMRCNWAKRVLFLADRVALVNQAVKAFKSHLPAAPPVNLVTEKDAEGRVFVSTYPTIMGLIDDTRDGLRRFGVGHFDLIVIDEAHRSVFQKYRAIFDYFDSLLVGLTATPKEEVDRNTYGLFDLENGVPTDTYPLEEAIKDRFLVAPRAVSVPLKFQREGIKYDELSDAEKEQWDETEWNDDGTTPTEVEAEAVNKWLFNEDTVDKVLEHLMTHGVKVAGGDRLGKTILFAKNQAHAEFIAERFDKNYAHHKGEFARVITFKTEYAQSLIDAFSIREKAPHIAISVDMLDTGIDVPEVVNLVFFKLVRSKTKFWQMMGRGTRLCPDLFGPGKHKDCFFVLDYCQNLEFFSQNPETTDGASTASMGKRLFTARLELVGELDRRLVETARTSLHPEEPLRSDIAALLRSEVCAMNLDNFVVRPQRRLVELYTRPEAWIELKPAQLTELAQGLAGLPTELEAEEEEAKRFDLLILNLQLALLRSEPGFERLKQKVQGIAELLEEKSGIPMVQQQLPVIEDLQDDEWWKDVTTPLLESVRKRLRLLIKLIDKQKRKPIYTDFEDEIGEGRSVDFKAFVPRDSFEQFREKARDFLRQHEDHLAIHRLRMNEPLTLQDLQELERMLIQSGVGDENQVVRAKEESHGLGLFVRSLTGLDREAAKRVFGDFLTGRTLNANQIEFINLIIEHLTAQGVIPASALYDSPFTDLSPRGPDGLFSPGEIHELVSVLDFVHQRAVA